MRSFLGVPVVFGGRVLGTLYLCEKQSAEEFTEEDEILASMIAVRAGMTMEVARLHEAEARERTRIAVLAEAGNRLAATLDRAERAHVLAELALPWLADLSLVYLREGDRLLAASVSHVDRALESELRERVPGSHAVSRADPESVLARAWREEATQLVSDYEVERVDAETRDPGLRELARRLDPRSLIVAPLAQGDEIGGLLVLALAGGDRRFGTSDVAYADEIAQRGATALENARLYEEARAAVRERDELLAVVSHDLRSPLQAIRMGAQLLASAPARAERRSDGRHIDIIRRASVQMELLIEDLLVEAGSPGTMTIRPGPDDAAAIIETTLVTFEPVAAAKKLRIEVDVPSDLPAIWADGPRLSRVLANLVGNAVKFAAPGGWIGVRARAERGEVLVEVADDGPGIPEEALSHVFERGWTAERGGPHGTGLGLHVARSIIELHGGRIWVESAPGRGARFFFGVPTADRASAAARGPEAASERDPER